MKILESCIMAIMALIFYAVMITVVTCVWALIFAFLGWLFPAFFQWLFEAIKAPNGEPWMLGVAVAILSMIFSRSVSKGN